MTQRIKDRDLAAIVGGSASVPYHEPRVWPVNAGHFGTLVKKLEGIIVVEEELMETGRVVGLAS